MRRTAAAAAGLLLVAGCADDSGRAAPVASTTTPATTAPSTTAATTTSTTESPGTTAASGPPSLRWRAATRQVQLTEAPNADGSAFYEIDYTTSSSGAIAYLGPSEGSFRVESHRADYDSPIESSARLAGRRIDLPDDSVTDWTGLDDFLTIEVTDSSGRSALSSTTSFCPAGYEHVRLAPTGPVTDPGGDGCSGHPLALGASWSIAEGWSVAVAPTIEGPALDPGSYEVTLAIAPRYAASLGDASITLPLEIVASDSSFQDLGTEGIVDLDGDGIDDAEDEFVDTDFDGIDDRSSEDLFVDPGGDGFDDRTGLTEDETTAKAGQISDETIDGTEPEAPEPTHEGRTGPAVEPPARALPDLASLPALDIGTSVDTDTGRDLLSFAAVTWNRGPAPMVIDGFARPDEPGVMDAFQQFGRVDGHETGSAPIGTLEYHAGGGHDHWHFLAFSRYDLLSEDGTELQRSGKESWCLADTDAIDTTRPGTSPTLATTLSSACGDQDAVWVRETLAVGWGDTYVQSVSGQAFDITDVPNGRYLIRLTANPERTIYENDLSNNVADRLVILGGVPGARTVEVPPVGLVDTESTERFPLGD